MNIREYGSKLGKSFGLAGRNAECCYIRLHQRGDEGAMLQAYLAGNLKKVRAQHEKNIQTAFGG